VPVKVYTKDNDKAWRELRERVRGLNGRYLSVGVQGERAQEPHPEARGGPPRITLGELAAAHELFPPPGVPRRPFIGPVFDAERTALKNGFTAAGRAVVFGEMTKRALQAFGDSVVEKVKQRILAGQVTPALAASTAAAKGDDRPLYETGALAEAITAEIGSKGNLRTAASATMRDGPQYGED